MKRLLLVFIFISLSVIHAQPNLSTEKVSFDKLVTSYRNFLYKDVSKALTFALQAKEAAIVSGNDKQQALAHYYIAKCQHNLSENKNALKNITTALEQAETLNDSKFLYNSLCLKGDILYLLGENSKALVAYVHAKTIAKTLGNPLYEMAPLANIAYIKKTHKDFQEALKLYKDILTYVHTIGNTKDTAHYQLTALMNIADIYLWLGNPEEAVFYNEAALKQCSPTKDARTYYPLLMNKAIIFYQKENYEKCIEIGKTVLDITKENDERLHLTALLYLGKSSYKLKAYKSSLQYLESAYARINASDNADINEKELHEFLALVHHENGNAEKTVFHFQKYTALEKKQSVEDIKVNNETHKLVDVVPLQTEIDKLDDELLAQTKTKKNLVIISILLFFLLAGSIFYYIKTKNDTKKKIKELLTKVANLEHGQEKKETVKKDIIFDEKARIILNKIADFEKQKHYLSPACSLAFMAERLETNTTYLSKVINTYKGKTFTAYITELRINTALIRLKNDKTLHSYTIQGIAEEFGYKRQETFSRAFKAYTGIYPSQYLKNIG